MIFPLEITGSGEKFLFVVTVSDDNQFCLRFAIHCVCWCYFYTVKQQPCKKTKVNNKTFIFKKLGYQIY